MAQFLLIARLLFLLFMYPFIYIIKRYRSHDNKKILYASIDLKTDGPSLIKNNILALGVVFMNKQKEIVKEFYSALLERPNCIADPDTLYNYWNNTTDNILLWNKIHALGSQQDYKTSLYGLSIIYERLLEDGYKIIWCSKSSYEWSWFKLYYDSMKSSYNYSKQSSLSPPKHCVDIFTLAHIFMSLTNNAANKNKLYSDLHETHKKNMPFSKNLKDAANQARLMINMCDILGINF